MSGRIRRFSPQPSPPCQLLHRTRSIRARAVRPMPDLVCFPRAYPRCLSVSPSFCLAAGGPSRQNMMHRMSGSQTHSALPSWNGRARSSISGTRESTTRVQTPVSQQHARTRPRNTHTHTQNAPRPPPAGAGRTTPTKIDEQARPDMAIDIVSPPHPIPARRGTRAKLGLEPA